MWLGCCYVVLLGQCCCADDRVFKEVTYCPLSLKKYFLSHCQDLALNGFWCIYVQFLGCPVKLLGLSVDAYWPKSKSPFEL